MGFEIITNKTKNSILKVTVRKVLFETLWDNFPSSAVEHETNGVINNYCAVNLSDALLKSGIGLKSFKGTKCWGCPSRKSPHAIRAQELANWLKRQPFIGCPKPERMDGSSFREKLDGRTGIVFFKDYWQRSSEVGTEHRTGDHIDLWDGRGVDKLASQSFLEDFLTNSLGMYYDGLYSDKKLSKEILFWEIK